MKRSEMNNHQRAMFDLMSEIVSDYIGGYENTMMDYDPADDEYKAAEAFLKMPHEEMAKFFYDEIMARCKSGSNASHARFAGGEFLKERIERRLNKWGY